MGGEGGGGGGQDRARERHLTATNMLSTFSEFNQREGEGGGAVRFWLIQLGGGGGVLLSAFGRFNQRGGGGGGAVRFQPIQPVGGAHVCKLLLQGGEGGGGASFSLEGGRGPMVQGA